MKYFFISLMLFAMLAGCKSSKVSTSQKESAKTEVTGKFEASMLYATPWRLVKLETPSKTIEVPAGEEATIIFNEKDSRVNGRCCNSYFGSFELKGNVVTFSNMGSTKMMCHGIIGEIETLYHSMLAAPQTISINTKKMVLKSDKGTLYFDAFNLE